jgi:proteic killer suppression protein
MKISFKEHKLEKIANDDRKLQKEYGKVIGKNITLRLQDLMNCTTLEDARNLPGKFHELKENRKGQWACSVDKKTRLIFVPHEEPIPENDNGHYIWSEIKGIDIIEIEDYH